MAGRWLAIGALMSAPLATLGAQSLCLGVPTSARVAWPAPLDRQVTLGAGVLGVREAIERAAAAAHVHFTYEASLLPRDRTVCTGSGLAGRARHFLDVTEAPLAIDERALLLAPAGGGQNQMRAFRRVGGREHVLHHEKFQFVERAARAGGINPRMRRVRGDDP